MDIGRNDAHAIYHSRTVTHVSEDDMWMAECGPLPRRLMMH